MNKTDFDMFCCPYCGKPLSQTGDALSCGPCRKPYPVVDGIPRFVPFENYAAGSFGFQWNKHARTQIDKFSGITLSRDRFFQVSGWPQNLSGQKILEAGCGASRFTQIALETGAKIYSFDLSHAVDANKANNGLPENLVLFQADIYKIPLPQKSFDKIFCFGVLQHCPDPHKAFLNLVRFLKPGGQIAFDIYDLTFRAFINPKYWLRPLTKRMPPQKLYRLVEASVKRFYPVKKWITERLPKGKYLAFFIPVAYHKGFFPQVDALPESQLMEWSVLDTFDKFAPRYDKPQTLGTVRSWLKEAGLIEIDVRYGPNGIIAKGRAR